MDEVKKAIQALAEKAKQEQSAHEAMQIAQAALNLAQVAATLDNLKK